MKKGPLLPVFYVVVMFSLAGCARKSNSIVLRYTAWGAAEETQITDASTEEFKKDHPGVDVQMIRVSYSEYVTKLLTQFAAGSAPDVMQVAGNDHFPSFASKGVFMDLEPYVEKDASFKLGDFYPEAVNRYTVGGQLMAIPRSVFPIAVVYYNKKEFDEAGLPYPKDNWDYLQFLKTAQSSPKRMARETLFDSALWMSGPTGKLGFILLAAA